MLYRLCACRFKGGSPASPAVRGKVMARVTMYSTAVCPFCVRAEQLLRRKGVTDIDKVRVDLDPQRRVEMMEKTGRRTVPQIYIGETHVGGCQELEALERAGSLDGLLAAS